MKRFLPFAIVVGVLLLALASGTVLFHFKQRAMKAAAKVSAGKPGAEPPHIRGSTKASVTLEEFGDFECMPCGLLFPVLEQVERDYGTRLQVIFRQFPLAMHKHALDAARASEAAGLQGRFWEMHDLLYRNRFIWPRAANVRTAFNDYAKALNLDVDQFERDMESEKVKARIASDQQRGASLGVDRTPILFINNRQVPTTAINPPGLHAAIDAALNGKPAL
jgi:protein-disulfide isomerase